LSAGYEGIGGDFVSVVDQHAGAHVEAAAKGEPVEVGLKPCGS
jgi:hypothetical protein